MEGRIVGAKGGAQAAFQIVIAPRRLLQLLQPRERCGITVHAILLRLGEFGCLCDGIVERAELVNEFEVQGLLSCPHTSLSDAINVGNAEFATISHAREEEGVAALYVCLHGASLTRRERTAQRTKVCAFAGLHHVEMEAQLVGEQCGGVGHEAENADAARQSGWFGHDIVCAARHIIAARCCQSTHGNHHGLFLLQLLDGAPHLLGSVGAATARIDAQYYGLDVVVLCQFVQVFDDLFAHDFVASAHAVRIGYVHDVAIGIIYSDAVVA